MRVSFADERVLAVVAHPDDAELLCAGTLARARCDGAVIGICVMCQGDKGQPTPPIPDLAAVRREEMKAAAQVLRAELLLGEFPDAALADGPQQRHKLVELMRRFRPTLVLAHGPEDYHADHRAASALADTATWGCAATGEPSLGPPLPLPPALWWLDAVSLGSFVPGFFIDITAHIEVKKQMLSCHRSQLERGGDRAFAPLEELMLQQARARGLQADVMFAEAFRLPASWKRLRAW
jgi:LmbE family N-acetylglucosaminyl deacetylase